jgi:hypothetical protein
MEKTINHYCQQKQLMRAFDGGWSSSSRKLCGTHAEGDFNIGELNENC